MRDWAVVVGPLDVQAKGGAVRGVADAALQAAEYWALLLPAASGAAI